MNNYSEKTKQNQYFLHFFNKGQGVEWIDAGLPTPHYLQHANSGYFIAWAIEGYFCTAKARAFIVDTVARYLLLFPDAERLPYKPYIEDREHSAHTIKHKPYKLKDIAQALPSLSWQSGEYTDIVNFLKASQTVANKKAKKTLYKIEDDLFEASRWHLYRYAYANGTDAITYEYVKTILETENSLLAKPRTVADIKAKAKRMTEYMRNEFIIHTAAGYNEWDKAKKAEYMRNYRKQKEVVEMTRSERAISNTKARAEKTKKKVINCITGLYAESEYKKKSGAWNISKIARDIKTDRKTVAKYLKAYLEKENTK